VTVAAAETVEIIEGTFRVVASRELPAPRKGSPNRRRAVARILFWNCAAVFAVVAVPYVLR
jgi:hypothetical protein